MSRLKRAPSEHKGHAGKVLLIGGAPGMAGALLLSGNASLHLGAGWTILEMLDPASAHAISEQAELMIRLASFDAQTQLADTNPDLIAIGPGLGYSVLAKDWLEAVLKYPSAPLVIDADALNVIADTPAFLALLLKRNQLNPGLWDIQADRMQALSQLVTLTQSLVVLKGQHTLIASPTYSAVRCMQGNPGMAIGGMGDVLTGSIAAIAAQGLRHNLTLWEATCVAVQLHASAADSLVAKQVGPIGLTPSEVIMEMRSILNKLL
ncbi:MAG: NAD(P)H-hydrate dehydratase [Polynucleobacter sp. 39-45-136]|nr:MAG: NAD(P)H-hydrate dehydratase [Polynucleobacter sp. 39-45-136]